ncbi:MAG TPA: MIP/aquaporin family protein [Steroidobacteraceae bacterium]|nr:MIP/aquaporin family protein [Steroidobacteraceae bacterium]
MSHALDRPLHGQPVPANRLHPRLYAAEAAGTALLVAVGLSIVIAIFARHGPIAAVLPSPGARRALAGAGFGTIGALIAISPLGRLSGAHINPAVSLAFWLEGKLAWRDLLGYVLAQMLGAAAGAVGLLLWGDIARELDFGATLVGSGVPLWLAFLGEAFATFALVLAIFISASHERTRAFTPWTIPPLFAWLVWWEAPLSGASANPARSFGPALISGLWGDFWIYVFAPLMGAALGIGLLRLELLGQHRVEVARVARHD